MRCTFRPTITTTNRWASTTTTTTRTMAAMETMTNQTTTRRSMATRLTPKTLSTTTTWSTRAQPTRAASRTTMPACFRSTVSPAEEAAVHRHHRPRALPPAIHQSRDRMRPNRACNPWCRCSRSQRHRTRTAGLRRSAVGRLKSTRYQSTPPSRCRTSSRSWSSSRRARSRTKVTRVTCASRFASRRSSRRSASRSGATSRPTRPRPPGAPRPRPPKPISATYARRCASPMRPPWPRIASHNGTCMQRRSRSSSSRPLSSGQLPRLQPTREQR